MSSVGPHVSSIMGVPSQMPGISTGPMPGAFGLGGGPNVPFTEWAPRGATPASRALNNFLRSGQPPSMHGHVTFMSNDFIQYQYTISPWDNGHHLQIEQGMLCFLAKEMDTKNSMYFMAALPMLNYLCKQNYAEYQAMVAEGYQEALEFQTLLETYGERSLEQHHWARATGRIEQWKKNLDGYNTISKDLDKLLRLAQKSPYRYLTRFGILQYWNFGGCVQNHNRAASLQELDRTDYTEKIVTINLVLGKKARTSNIWGELKNTKLGSKQFLILRRKRLSDGSFGAFEIRPYSCVKRSYPPASECSYVDDSGQMVKGYTWSIGTVIEQSDREPMPSAVELASGIGLQGNPKLAHDAHARLPFMYLALGI